MHAVVDWMRLGPVGRHICMFSAQPMSCQGRIRRSDLLDEVWPYWFRNALVEEIFHLGWILRFQNSTPVPTSLPAVWGSDCKSLNYCIIAPYLPQTWTYTMAVAGPWPLAAAQAWMSLWLQVAGHPFQSPHHIHLFRSASLHRTGTILPLSLAYHKWCPTAPCFKVPGKLLFSPLYSGQATPGRHIIKNILSSKIFE